MGCVSTAHRPLKGAMVVACGIEFVGFACAKIVPLAFELALA